MNVYDFDGTIYDGDSSVDFYRFMVRKKPRLILFFPRQLFALVLYKLKKYSTTEFKEIFFSFLLKTDNLEKYVSLFWEENFFRIKSWYLNQKKESDLIISASPEFLIIKIAEILGIQTPIATKCNPNNGKIYGENCKGEEKVRRYRENYPSETIDCFYSDSYHDLPLALIARKAYFVKKNKIQTWNIKQF